MTIIYFVLAALVGYLCGAVPFGYIYVKLKTGKTLTAEGSGRTGGTNSMRAAGWQVGVLTGLSDVFKGICAIFLARWITGWLGADVDLTPWIDISAGILSVVGHNWSIFIRGAGGAGTGPNVGWATAVWWPMFPIGFVLMVSGIFFLGYASVASMTMALVIACIFGGLWLFGAAGIVTPAYFIGGLATTIIVGFSLRGNFQRLMRGEERLVGMRAMLRERQKQTLNG